MRGYPPPGPLNPGRTIETDRRFRTDERANMVNRSTPFRTSVAMVVAVSCLARFTDSAWAMSLPPLPSMACPVIASDAVPNIDGVLDEAVWSTADVQTVFHRHYGGLKRPQSFGLLTDGKWLYISCTANEKTITDGNLEIVQVHFAPHKESDQHVSYSVQMTAKGMVKVRFPGLEEGRDWKAAFRQYDDRWVLELAIRAEPVFGGDVHRGKVFDLNCARTRYHPDGDVIDIYQQWSDTGTSSESRYRFGEVTFGSPSDRLPMIRAGLQAVLDAVREKRSALSGDALKQFDTAHQVCEALLAAAPGDIAVTSAAVGAYQSDVHKATRVLQRRVLAPRGVIVWACNPMATPGPADLPPADLPDAPRLEVRVLANEFESAALVVTNLHGATLEGQVQLSDFVSADGATKFPGWDVVQVRTAPMYHLHTGRSKRDPLPRLQEGALFRVPADENELLWLTFRSRDMPPGKYKASMIVRSLDDRLRHVVELVLRVYPLALGAKGRPHVNSWNSLLRGKNQAEAVAFAHDHYLTCALFWTWDELPVFTADGNGDIIDETLDFTRYDKHVDEVIQTNMDTYLAIVETHKYRFWPMRLQGQKWNDVNDKTFPIKRWSPRFNEVFAKWVRRYRDHLASKGLGPDRWAFYIMDEPAVGEERQEVIEFAKQVKATDPQVRNYVTLPVKGIVDDDQNIELSRYVDLVQYIGHARPHIMAAMRENTGGLWQYTIGLRQSNPFHVYRRTICWDVLRRGDIGTGFWVWDASSQSADLWKDGTTADPKGEIFAALYNSHDNAIVPSLRAEAFREGIEDWKYVLMLDKAIERAQQKGVDPSVIDSAKTYRARCLSELTDEDSAYVFRDVARSHLLALHIALGDVDRQAVEAIEAD